MLTAFLWFLACGGGEDTGAESYDVDAWQSPLAAGFEGEPDAVAGQTLFFEETWGDTSAYQQGCSSCHHGEAADTLLVDSDAYNRPGHTIWNAPYREVWKGSQDWDKETSGILGAYGGQVCVLAYMPSGAEMTAEQAAHLEAYMKTLRDEEKPGDDPRAEPLDFSFNTWTTQDDFVAGVQDEDGAWRYGAEIGDVDRGAELTERYCGACHTRDGAVNPGASFTDATLDMAGWIARVRKADVGDTGSDNERMARLTWDRLSDGDLADLLAYVTAHYGIEDGG